MNATIRTFKTKGEARLEKNGMIGWPGASPVQKHMPLDPNADKHGNVWVIECKVNENYSKYLREDEHIY